MAETRRRFTGLALLIFVNGLVLGVVAYVLATWLRLNGAAPATFWILLLGNLFDGIRTAQLLLIGFWCALAPERLVRRLLVGIALVTLPLGIYLLIFFLLSPTDALGAAAEEAGRYCGLALVTFFLLRALRPWLGWRLSWQGAAGQPAGRRFRILDLLAWTAAIAVPLGLLQTLYGTRSWPLVLDTVIDFVSTLPITIQAFWWAMSTSPRKIAWLWALAIGTPIAIAVLLLLIGGVGVMRIRLPLLTAYYLPLLLVLTLSVLALERIGLRPAAKA